MDFENNPFCIFDSKEVQALSMFTFETSFPVLNYSKKDPHSQEINRLLKVDVKCMLNQEFLIWKERNLNKKIELVDIKHEYSFFLEQRYLNDIAFLQQNFNEEDDAVQIIVLCAQGVKVPREQDFQLFFKCVDSLKRGKSELKNFLDALQRKSLYRLLMCSAICEFQQLYEPLINRLSKNLTLESLIKLLFIIIQYEIKDYAIYFYSLLIQYFQYEAGVLPALTNPQLQEIIYNLPVAKIVLLENDIFMLETSNQQIKIDSLFFKPLYKNILNRKKKFVQPLQKYQFFKNMRKRSPNSEVEGAYPHIFYLKDEAENQTHLVAYQDSPHGEIQIYEKEQLQYLKYTEDYLGVIERNYWGTTFSAYDNGYPEEIAHKFPAYIGSKRVLIAQITYETNIMASVPRKFLPSMLNFVNMNQMNMKQLEPVYNAEKDCYQLNFYGRAKRASARNFEIIDTIDPNIIYLLHGKVDKNLFNMDYRYPMTQLQAFSFSLVSISKKFLVS